MAENSIPRRDRTRLILVSRWTWVVLGTALAVSLPLWRIYSGTGGSRAFPLFLAGVGACIALQSLLPTRWFVRTSLLTVMSLLTCVGIEFTLQSWMSARLARIHDWHPKYLYAHRPGSQKLFRHLPVNGGQSIPVVINQSGFRGSELDPQHRQLRVAVYGDSFIAAEFSQEPETFVGQLGQRLSADSGQPVEMVNAGVVGYGPDQVLLKLEDELPQVRPDLLVVSLFADNDFGDLLRNKLFRLDAEGQLLPNAWTRGPGCLHPSLQPTGEPIVWQLLRKVVRGIESSSGTTTSYMPRWLAACEAEYAAIQQGDTVVRELQVDHYDADVALTPDAPSAHYKQQLLSAVVRQIQQTCAAAHVPVLVMVIPSPADLIENYDFCQIDRAQFPDYDPRRLSDTMTRAAEAAGLPVVNLYPPFAAAEPASLYFRGGDNHWNAKGQELAARIVARAIQEQGWLPADHHSAAPIQPGRQSAN